MRRLVIITDKEPEVKLLWNSWEVTSGRIEGDVPGQNGTNLSGFGCFLPVGACSCRRTGIKDIKPQDIKDAKEDTEKQMSCD